MPYICVMSLGNISRHLKLGMSSYQDVRKDKWQEEPLILESVTWDMSGLLTFFIMFWNCNIVNSK